MGLDILAWVLSAPVLILTAAFAAEVLLGLRIAVEQHKPGVFNSSCVIVIPAHDEQASIAACVEGASSQAVNTTVLVVADNCSDQTASLARASRAEVVERNEPDVRGKAYALAFARDHLRKDPPDVVIILDADCELASGAAAIIAGKACAEQRPVQATNLLRALPGASPLVQFSNFAFYLKNRVRQSGLARLGAPALLNGTGMALPWAIFDEVELTTDSLAEDLELGVELARVGKAPMFEPAALVLSNPAGAKAMVTQRSRWEGGFLATSVRFGFPLLIHGVRSRRWSLAWLGLHLLIPPLTLLMLLNLLCLFLAAVSVATGSGPWLISSMLVAQALASAAVILAWVSGGRTYLSVRAAMQLPLYLAWKVPLYWSLLMKQKKEWVRTERS